MVLEAPNNFAGKRAGELSDDPEPALALDRQ
jgi:hypothetical protein